MPRVVALGEHGTDFVHAQLVVAGPRLVALQGVDPAGDRGAVLVLALVGVDLGQVDLGELGELVLDLVRAERVVVRDRQVRLGGHGALDGALGTRHSRHLAGLAGCALGLSGAPAGGALGRAAHLAQRVGGAGLGHVVGALAVELRPRHGVGQPRDLLAAAGRASSARRRAPTWPAARSWRRPALRASRASAV